MANTASFPSNQRETSSLKQGDKSNVLKNASKGVCTPTAVVQPDLIS